MIFKLSLPRLSPRTVSTVTHNYDTSTVLSHLLLAKTDRILDVIFKSVRFASLLLLPNFMFKLLAGQKVSSNCTESI